MSVAKVRAAMKNLIAATKKLKTSRTQDVFAETNCNFSYERITYGTDRQMGTFSFSYVVSPVPESGNTAPSITFDDIARVFKRDYSQAFYDQNLIIISYSYEQGDVITDPESGSVSLGFVINIKVIDKS